MTQVPRSPTVVNMHQAKSQLSKLVEQAEAGETIVIARNGVPAAKLVSLEAEAKPSGWSKELLEYAKLPQDDTLYELFDDATPAPDKDLF